MLVRCEHCGVVKQAPAKVVREVLRRCPTFFDSEADQSQVRLLCKDCGALYRIVSLDEESHESRLCEDCGSLIPMTRIEAVPGALRCVPCQERADNKTPGQIDRACPRCDGKLRWKVRQRTGTAQYFIGCDNWPRCWYSE